MGTLTDAEAHEFLKSIERGEVKFHTAPGQSWGEVFAGNVEFIGDNGWRLFVFNDCDSWDYVDQIVAPDGRAWEFDVTGSAEDVFNWLPESEAAVAAFPEGVL